MDSDILRHFTHRDLPYHKHRIVAEIRRVAEYFESNLQAGEEKAASLRKLLEAMDCAIRASPDPEVWKQSVSDLNVHEKLKHALKSAGLWTIGDVARKSPDELRQLPGIDDVYVETVRAALGWSGAALRGESVAPSR